MFNNKTYHSGEYIKDSDNNLWAKKEHFTTDKDGKATKLNDTTWFEHLDSFQPGRDWNVYTAEGYDRGDPRRFPLGLNDSPGRSNHITGDAIDINSDGFLNKNDTKIDIIALYFGLSRPVPFEQWHFEPTNLQLSDGEIEEIKSNDRNSTK
jgi:hypothetical protein